VLKVWGGVASGETARRSSEPVLSSWGDATRIEGRHYQMIRREPGGQTEQWQTNRPQPKRTESVAHHLWAGDGEVILVPSSKQARKRGRAPAGRQASDSKRAYSASGCKPDVRNAKGLGE